VIFDRYPYKKMSKRLASPCGYTHNHRILCHIGRKLIEFFRRSNTGYFRQRGRHSYICLSNIYHARLLIGRALSEKHCHTIGRLFQLCQRGLLRFFDEWLEIASFQSGKMLVYLSIREFLVRGCGNAWTWQLSFCHSLIERICVLGLALLAPETMIADNPYYTIKRLMLQLASVTLQRFVDAGGQTPRRVHPEPGRRVSG